MVDHLEDISDHAYRLLREEISDVFEQLSQEEAGEERDDEHQKTVCLQRY